MDFLYKNKKVYTILLILISLVFSASPLLAAETAELTSSSIIRSKTNRIQKPSADIKIVDFNLDNDYVADEVLIKFADWTPVELIANTIGQLNLNAVDTGGGSFSRIKIDWDRIKQIRNPRTPRSPRQPSTGQTADQTSLQDVLEALNKLPYVEWAEPNYVAKALALPNDPYYSLQWNFPQIGVDKAWDQSQGQGATIAIVDTGVAYEKKGRYKQAPDLAGTNFVAGYNFLRNNSHANDDNGHGTHVAGTIAGSTNNSEGVAGIAYKASIMPLKALDKSGSGTYADIAEAIRWAADQGADIINLSLGGPVSSNVLKEAVAYAAGKNVLIVAAAGNDGSGHVLYPAAYDDYVLAVGAVRYDKTKSNFSSYGSSLDLMAPGGDTGVDQNSDGYPDGILQQTLKQNFWGADTRKFNYYFYQGTSMAAPHVAAVAALVKSLGINDAQDIRQILFDSAEDLEAPGWDKKTGYGLVRADEAVQLAQQITNNQQLTTNNNSSPKNEQPAVSNSDETNPQTSEPPAQEPANNNPAPEPPADKAPAEPTLKDLIVKALTYNMWGRVDSSYAFWEKAILGLEVKDAQRQSVAGSNLDVKVFNNANKLVAQGQGRSDKNGELWLSLGNFAKGSYTVLVEAVKDGFKSVIKSTSFRFR